MLQQGGCLFRGAPCPLRLPFPQLLGPPRGGLLIRADFGQQRLRLRLFIRVSQVHALWHAHPRYTGHFVTEGIEHVKDRLNFQRTRGGSVLIRQEPTPKRRIITRPVQHCHRRLADPR